MVDTGLQIEMPGDHPGVMLVSLDRPPVNALDRALFGTLAQFFAGFEERKDVRCIVLTGNGRVFSAGADTREMSTRTTESQLAKSVVSRAAFDSIRRCAVPIVGAVNGSAVGAGLVIAACCDIVVASEAARFSLPEVTVGVLGGTRHTRRIMPDKLMRYLALTGEGVDARTVERHGGLLATVTPDRLLPEAFAIADRIAANSPAVVRLMKEAMNLTEDMPVTEGYRVEQLFTTIASGMSEALAATEAASTKR